MSLLLIALGGCMAMNVQLLLSNKKLPVSSIRTEICGQKWILKMLKRTTVAVDRGIPVDLYHEIHGNGKHKVLFITGWAGSCDNWRFQTEFFGRHGTRAGFTSNLDYMLKFHGGRIDSRPPQSFSSALRQLSGIISFRISSARLDEPKIYFLRSSIPAMVIHGTEDALVHLRSSWDLARMLGARLVFEGRHALNHEDTELFNRLLLRHFYTAILPSSNVTSGSGLVRVEEAARRAGWWLTEESGFVGE
ncbi:hypothetical protein BJ741DRAFT_579465 [Chytriomyces cf. hyalinus JEL632]|nr:hypothetical protein BJ741DRAFT_579465 [Chytriomyces cf. hyalinus JEL632]